MKLSELKTIDIVALGYRDTVNGNSYFSSLGFLNIEEEKNLCNEFLNESLKLQNIGDI